MKVYEQNWTKVIYKNCGGILPDEPIGLRIYEGEALHMMSMEKAISIRNLLHKAIIDMSIDTGETKGVIL
jgi:hypothetical protein